MDNTTNSNPLDENEKTISRRRLLQAIAATGGAVVVSTLPDKWIAPVIEAGALPAHAQASAANLTIFNLSRTLVSLNTCNKDRVTGTVFQLSFEYDDPMGEVQPGGSTILHQTSTFLPIRSSTSFQMDIQSTQITGDGFTGTITYQLCSRFGNSTDIAANLFITVGSRQSNVLENSTSKPVGAQGDSQHTPSESPL